MKLIEKLMCLNRYLVLVTQSPRTNGQHLGFVFLAVLALDQAITSKFATSTLRSTRADATCCPSSTRLYQCCQDLSMSEMRQHEAETSNTQSVTTSALYVQSRSGSRCSRDRRISRHTLLDFERCLCGNHIRTSMDCERVRDSLFSIVTGMSASFRT